MESNENTNTDNKANKTNLVDTIKKYKKVYFIVLLTIFVISIILIVVNVIDITKEDKDDKNKVVDVTPKEQDNTQKEQSNLIPRKIDGVPVESGKENVFPYATVIENSVDARPLSGINEASVIYEIQAEGSITRFLAIYASGDKTDKIGPVRSARPYYAELADEYNPLFIHFGGSPEVLDKINKGFYNFVDMNGIVYDQIYFNRDTSRKAPHNAYTSTDLIQQYLEKIGKDGYSGNYSSWKFSDSAKTFYQQKDIEDVSVVYNKEVSLYNIVWKYNKENKNFVRYLANGNEKYLDDKGSDVVANNIIIQFVTSQVIDEALRKSINLTEGGKAIMIRDGKYVEGYWSKNNITNRTEFFSYDENGKQAEFEFKPGKIWIHIVPKENYDLIKK